MNDTDLFFRIQDDAKNNLNVQMLFSLIKHFLIKNKNIKYNKGTATYHAMMSILQIIEMEENKVIKTVDAPGIMKNLIQQYLGLETDTDIDLKI